MNIIRFFNERVKRLNIFDIKLAQGCAMLIAVIIVKLFPQILEIGLFWFVAAIIILGIRPVYAFFIRHA